MKKIYLFMTALVISMLSLSAQEQVITDENLPEGTRLENYAKEYETYDFMGSKAYLAKKNGAVVEMLETEDALYLKNPISAFLKNTWMKLTKTDNGELIFDQQLIYENKEYNETAYICKLVPVIDEWGGDSFAPDSIDSTIKFVWRNDSLIMQEDCKIGIYYYYTYDDGSSSGYYDGGFETNVKIGKFTDTAVTFDEQETQTYFMDFLPYTYSDTPESKVVNVKIDGNKVYLGNIPGAGANAYVEGELADNNTVTFKSGPYIGINGTSGVYTYFYAIKLVEMEDGAGETIFKEFKDETIVFTYDPETKALKSSGMFAISCGNLTLDVIDGISFIEPSLELFNEVAAIPADPVITFNMSDDFGHYMNVDMPLTDVDGKKLNINKMFFNIFLDNTIIDLADYDSYVGESMVDIPYSISCDAIYGYGASYYIFFNADKTPAFEKMGVQAIYLGGNETKKSSIVYTDGTTVPWDDSAVNGVKGDKVAEKIVYTDLAGRRVVEPQNGIYIKTVKYTDGSCENTKVLVRNK